MDFDLDLEDKAAIKNIKPLIEAYAKWGVRFALMNSNVNQKSKWTPKTWINKDIISVYTQEFVKFANYCIEKSIRPIFSPLVPGGDYNDLAFLFGALKQLKPHTAILDKTVLAVYAHHHGRSLNWGAGGKRRWKRSRIFIATGEGQDHIGFRAFEWYQEISNKALGMDLPVILLETGRVSEQESNISLNESDYQEKVRIVMDLLAGHNVYLEKEENSLYAPISPNVLACIFYLISADNDSPLSPYRWFRPDGELLSTAKTYRLKPSNLTTKTDQLTQKDNQNRTNPNRYIFFDNSIKGSMPLALKGLDDYIRQYRPRMGYSLLEAAGSAHILVVTCDKDQFMLENESLIPENSMYKVIQLNEINNTDAKGYPHAE